MFFTMKDTMGRGKNVISQEAETQPSGHCQKPPTFQTSASKLKSKLGQ